MGRNVYQLIQLDEPSGVPIQDFRIMMESLNLTKLSDSSKLAVASLSSEISKLNPLDDSFEDNIQNLWQIIQNIEANIPKLNVMITGIKTLLTAYAKEHDIKLKNENSILNMADIDAAVDALHSSDVVQDNFLLHELRNTGLLTESTMNRYLSDQMASVVKMEGRLMEALQGQPLSKNDKCATCLRTPQELGLSEDNIIDLGTKLIHDDDTAVNSFGGLTLYHILEWLNPSVNQLFSDFGAGSLNDNAFNIMFCQSMYLLISDILDRRTANVEKMPYVKCLYRRFMKACREGLPCYRPGGLAAIVMLEICACIEIETFKRINKHTKRELYLVLQTIHSSSMDPNQQSGTCTLRRIYTKWLTQLIATGTDNQLQLSVDTINELDTMVHDMPSFRHSLCNVTSTSQLNDIPSESPDDLLTSSLVSRFQVELTNENMLDQKIMESVNRMIQENYTQIRDAKYKRDASLNVEPWLLTEQQYLCEFVNRHDNTSTMNLAKYNLAVVETTDVSIADKQRALQDILSRFDF